MQPTDQPTYARARSYAAVGLTAAVHALLWLALVQGARQSVAPVAARTLAPAPVLGRCPFHLAHVDFRRDTVMFRLARDCGRCRALIVEALEPDDHPLRLMRAIEPAFGVAALHLAGAHGGAQLKG